MRRVGENNRNFREVGYKPAVLIALNDGAAATLWSRFFEKRLCTGSPPGISLHELWFASGVEDPKSPICSPTFAPGDAGWLSYGLDWTIGSLFDDFTSEE